ncbi:hypothetical protein LCGC14_1587540 [marine sediment metagenome]|uniref:Uncharacterized protein n=1 Tax=marine sediment metagenome TaxID=412755 RepID=A0A0F9IEZ1_9ZZZZ
MTQCPSGRIPWAEIIERAQEDDMAVQELTQQAKVAGLFAQAQGYALRGKPLPAALRATLKYLLALAG